MPSEYIRDNIMLSVQHVERTAIEMRHHLGVDHLMFATDFPHIECDWPETRSYVERMFAGVPWDEAYPILAGNMIKFFHLEDTPMAQKVEAQAKVAVGHSDTLDGICRAPGNHPGTWLAYISAVTPSAFAGIVANSYVKAPAPVYQQPS
jgi:hypothetical protein